jgi:hypothetical protein
LIGDHPVYFARVNLNPFPTAINVYGFAEHCDFYTRYLQTSGHRVLDDPARHIEIGCTVGSEFKRRYTLDSVIDFFEPMSEQVRAQLTPASLSQEFAITTPGLP